MTQPRLRKVAIVGASRIPFARSNTVYERLSNQEMLSAALDGLVQHYGLTDERIGGFATGTVLKHARDCNLAREVVLGSSLAPETLAYDLRQAYGIGLEACILVANKIAMGQIESGVAGGSDTVSDAPIAVSCGARPWNSMRPKHRSDQCKTFLKRVKPENLIPEIPNNGEPRTGLPMGQHCELTTQRWDIPREEQDQFALDSHRKPAAVCEAGFLDNLLTPCVGLNRDNNLRPGGTLEKLGSLLPVFDHGHGTLTAANIRH